MARVRTRIAAVANALFLVGANHPLAESDGFVDFDLELLAGRGRRPPFGRNVRLHVDGRPLFAPVPLAQAYAMFEWGLNWCIAMRSDRFLLVHSAVVERGGKALLLPAPPGSGKSTLCAALVLRGWRLLSDELSIVARDGTLVPVPRPVSLKNASIDVIREFEPAVVIGGEAHETIKGTVAYMRPGAESVARQSERAVPGWIAFPKFETGASRLLTPYSKAQTLVYLAANSFNYHIHGERGFELLGDIVDRSECFRLTYGSLDDALRCVDEMTGSTPHP